MNTNKEIDKLERNMNKCFGLITKLDERLTTLEDSTKSDYDY